MSWGLESATKELAADLKKAGIEVNIAAHTVITPDTAIRLPANGKSDEYKRWLRDAINRTIAAKKAAIKAKQVPLL